MAEKLANPSTIEQGWRYPAYLKEIGVRMQDIVGNIVDTARLAVSLHAQNGMERIAREYPSMLDMIPSERYSNYEDGDPDNIFEGFLDVSRGNADLGNIDPEIGVFDLAKLVINFTDVSRLQHFPDCVYDAVNPALYLIDGFIETYPVQGRIGLSDQLKLALKTTDGDMPKALLALFLATRQLARNADHHIMSNESTEHTLCDEDVTDTSLCGMTADSIRMWIYGKNAFSAFPDSPNCPEGDVYHFWGTFCAGYVSAYRQVSGLSKGQNVVDTGLEFMYKDLQSRLILWRNKLLHRPNITHGEIDALGYDMGYRMYSHMHEMRQN